MPDYEVVIKNMEPQWVASQRRVVPNYPSVGTLIGELFAGLGPYGAGVLLTGIVYYDDEYKESDVDAEAVAFLKQRPPQTLPVRVYELPGATMASLVYNGLRQAYQALLQWIGQNGYQVAGPNRELYLYCAMPVRQDDETYVTEIHFPVEKV